MSNRIGEEMVLDFDGFLGRQDAETREGIQQHLNIIPEEGRPAEKQRLASMYAVSEATGIDLDTVNERWDTLRGGYAEKLGGDWLAVKDDDSKFFGKLVEQKTNQRDERHMVFGPDDRKAPDAEKLGLESLTFRVEQAAKNGENYAGALSGWQEAMRKRPGYVQARESAYADIARRSHEAMAAVVSKVRPVAEQAVEQISMARGVKEGAGDATPFALFRGMTPEEKKVAFELMAKKVGTGGDKGKAAAFFERVGRGAENQWVKGGNVAWRQFLIEHPFKEGERVATALSDDPIEQMQLRYNAKDDTSVEVGGLLNVGTLLTKEKAAAWNQRRLEEIDDVSTKEDLRKFGQQVVDPAVAGSWLFQKTVLATADSIPLIASMMVPGMWIPAIQYSAGNYAGDEYDRLRGLGMDMEEANRLSKISGFAEALLDKAEAGLLAGKIPITKTILERFALRGGRATRFAANFAGTLAAETTIELTQDHIIPALVQDNLATNPEFDVHWGEVWREAAKAAPETMLGMVILSGGGGAFQTYQDTKANRAFSENGSAMRLRGYSMEQIAEIQALPVDQRGELLAKYLPAKAPKGAEQAALIDDSIKLATKEQAAFAAKLEAETAITAEAAQQAIRVTGNKDGWSVTHGDGKVVSVDTAEAARRIREDLMQATTQKEAEAFIAIADTLNRMPGATGETSVTPDIVTSEGTKVEKLTPGEGVTEIRDPKALAKIREQGAMDGETEVDVMVNGSNSVEFAESVVGAARETIVRAEVNQSESASLTAIHEHFEGRFRAGIASGTLTKEGTQQAIASIAPAFDPAKARAPQEKAFRERVQRVGAGKATDLEMQETVSELVVADFMGRRKDSTRMPAGALTTAIDAALLNATVVAKVQALGKFRAILRAAKKWFRGVFGTVAALAKARREGKGAEFDALVDHLMGRTEQVKADTAAAEEAEKMAGEAGIEAPKLEADEKAFSISPGNRVELVIKRIDDALAKDPTKRRVLARAANDRLQTLAFNFENERMTPKGDRIRPVVEKRSAESLDKEQAFRQADIFRAELERYGLTGADANRSKVFKDAMKSERFQEVFETLTENGWSEGEASKMADVLGKEAKEKFNEKVKRALNTAHEAAFEWRREQDELQKEDWNPKASLIRDLQTFNAILSVMPAEIRGKVGGFVKLAQLGEEGRAKEIGKRIEKLSGLVETHLQKETTEAMDKLAEKAAPDREAGKSSRGKIGVEAHRYFDAVATVRGLTVEQVEAERAKIDAGYASPALTQEQALDLFERQQILDTFGAWDAKSAADMDAAFTAAEGVYREGRNRWRMVEETRLNEVSAMADEVSKHLGGPSYAGSQAQKTASKLKKVSLDLKSFSEVMDTLIGENHPLAKRWSRAAQNGFSQKSDGIRALNKRWNEALTAATGKKILDARRALWDMGDKKKQTVTVDTAGESKGSTQDVPISLIDAWERGEGDPSSLGISNTEAAQLKADRAAMDPASRKQSLPLKREARGPGEVAKLTEAEAIFMTMLGAQEQYGAALDAAGWNKAALKQMEDQLSDPAKKLRSFLRDEYRNGYAPLAGVFERMFGVALPQIKNYAPAAFYHLGAERAMDPAAGGVIEGGMRAGFLKNRKQHAAAPRLENAFATFFGHANQTEHWKGLAEFVREFSSVMGRPEVKRSIEAAHGPEMLAALGQWTKALEGNGLQVQSGITDGVVSWLTGVQAKIKLAWNLGTIMKQTTAVLGSAFRIPLTAYARGFGKLMAGQLQFREIFNSPTIQRRLESGFAPEVRDALNNVWNAKPSRFGDFVEKGMETIGFVDAFFTAGSAAIAFDYHLQEAEKSGLAGESARAAAMAEVEDIVNRTAQPADAVNRSLFELRLNSIGKLMFMFASEARQKSSLWLTAWGRTLTGKATKADLRVLAICHLVIGPMIAAITAGWRDARDDDDDELFDTEHWSVGDFLKSVVAGPTSGVPLIGAALSGFRNDGIFGSATKRNSSLLDMVTGPGKREDEPVEWYVDKITTVMRGMDAVTGVAGSIADQTFSVIDNVMTDEDEQNAKDRRAIRREQKENREE